VGRGISRQPWARVPRIASIVKINIYFMHIIAASGVRGWGINSLKPGSRISRKSQNPHPENRRDAAPPTKSAPPATWESVSCPASAAPDVEVKIIVRRK
jgi:hypothetical protein